MQVSIIERPSSRSVEVAAPITSRLGPPSILTRVGKAITERLGPKVGERGGARGGHGGRGGRGGGGRGRGRGGGGRQPRQGVTLGDLDAEMEEYMSGETGGEPAQPDLGGLLVGRREVISYDGVDAPPNVE